MTEIIFHGGAREVGRSCIELASEDKRILLDCGVKLTKEESEYPVEFDELSGIDAVFISHAHLDHTGALPWADHNDMDCPILMTEMTRYMTKLLLKDAFKIGRLNHEHLGYDELDIKKVLRCISRVKIDTKGNVGGISYEYFDAGHIPGSAAVYVDFKGTRFLYTGDINTIETGLLYPAEMEFPEVDVLICESTYGDREHPARKKTEKDFIDAVNSVISRGGSVVVPVFAVGRAQELLLLLGRSKLKAPVYFDGLGIEVTEMLFNVPDSVKDGRELENALKKVKVVGSEKDRFSAMRGRSIILTTSGMLTGGPVLKYLKYLRNNADNAVFMTGYQAEGTNGRLLAEKKEIFIDGEAKIVKCDVRQFDFSAHAGLSELKALVRKIKPKKVFFVHGEEKSVLALAEWASALGMESFAPKLGERFKI